MGMKITNMKNPTRRCCSVSAVRIGKLKKENIFKSPIAVVNL